MKKSKTVAKSSKTGFMARIQQAFSDYLDKLEKAQQDFACKGG